METKLLRPQVTYHVETLEEFEERYSGFGKETYDNIKKYIPEIFDSLVFYKCIDCQLEDSYAEYKNDQFPFCIQLDPLIEVIVLWNKSKHIEIGYWSKNEYLDTINFIKSEFLQ